MLHALLRSYGLIRQIQEPYFTQFGVSGSQWGVLRVLQRAELQGESELPLKTVSERMLIQPPSVTGAVDRLERLGLVRRASSPTDLRVRHLSLTTQGRDLISRVLVGHADRVRSLFAGLRLDEQETILQLLNRLKAHLEVLATSPALPEPATKPRRGKPTKARRSSVAPVAVNN